MRLGLSIGYWTRSDDVALLDLVRAADELGYHEAWASEAYGSDAVSVLGALAVTTRRIRLGSAIMQVPGRTAANTAMSAATLDVLSGGRFDLGLGVSGPQVSEGWHGVRFDRPGTRLREYVEVVRLALSGGRLAFGGQTLQLPLPDGPGVPLPLTIRPVQQPVPVLLATLGPRNLELTGRIADGWLGVMVAAERVDDQAAQLRAGLEQREDADVTATFRTVVTLPTCIGPDIAACRNAVRPWLALYVGGMGSRETNFYHRAATDLGFGVAADQVQDRYLAGDRPGAMAAVPDELIDMTCLVGDVQRVEARVAAYEAAGITDIALAPQARDVEGRIAMISAVAPGARARGWIG